MYRSQTILLARIYSIQEAGIVCNDMLHRDIKPSNTLVTQEGRLVILDFGLVAELDIISSLTGKTSDLDGISDSEIIGTAAYMSPEQAAGLHLTTASDLYAVGVILFQALTGRLPFAGDQRLVLRDKQRFDSATPSEIVSGIPEDLNGSSLFRVG
jgi:serine/threonine protein kinase